MNSAPSLVGFALVSLGMVLTPGPNMLYLISRSICQGRKAGFISLIGVATGFLFYMICAACGVTTLLFAVPLAYDTLRFGGAIYLLYLAWQTVKSGGSSLFQMRELPKEQKRKLFLMGLFTNLLNPKIALLYLALLPQFIDPKGGSIFLQSLGLGLIQICTSLTVNALIVVVAGSVAAFLSERPAWTSMQRWLMGTLLAGLSVRLAMQARK